MPTEAEKMVARYDKLTRELSTLRENKLKKKIDELNKKLDLRTAELTDYSYKLKLSRSKNLKQYTHGFVRGIVFGSILGGILTWITSTM